MAGNGFSPRRAGNLIDAAHIVVGIIAVAAAVFAIINPERNARLFPVVFLCASVISFITGIFNLRMYKRDRRKQTQGILYIAAGVLIMVVFIISAISLWIRGI